MFLIKKFFLGDRLNLSLFEDGYILRIEKGNIFYRRCTSALESSILEFAAQFIQKQLDKEEEYLKPFSRKTQNPTLAALQTCHYMCRPM